MYHSRRLILIVVAGCCLALLLSCAAGVLSVRQRWVTLPAFAARLGPVWITSCSPLLEMTSSLGCVSSAGDMRLPSDIWLMIRLSPYDQNHIYRLFSIPR